MPHAPEFGLTAFGLHPLSLMMSLFVEYVLAIPAAAIQ
jgi:hypothetical protein